MKILCISKPTEAFRALPPNISLQLLESALPIMMKQREEGKILEFYATPIGYSVAILNYNSVEEWVREQKDLPILNYYEYEIYPLADGLEIIKDMIDSLKARKV